MSSVIGSSVRVPGAKCVGLLNPGSAGRQASQTNQASFKVMHMPGITLLLGSEVSMFPAEFQPTSTLFGYAENRLKTKRVRIGVSECYAGWGDFILFTPETKYWR